MSRLIVAIFVGVLASLVQPATAWSERLWISGMARESDDPMSPGVGDVRVYVGVFRGRNLVFFWDSFTYGGPLGPASPATGSFLAPSTDLPPGEYTIVVVTDFGTTQRTIQHPTEPPGAAAGPLHSWEEFNFSRPTEEMPQDFQWDDLISDSFDTQTETDSSILFEDQENAMPNQYLDENGWEVIGNASAEGVVGNISYDEPPIPEPSEPEPYLSDNIFAEGAGCHPDFPC